MQIKPEMQQQQRRQRTSASPACDVIQSNVKTFGPVQPLQVQRAYFMYLNQVTVGETNTTPGLYAEH